MIREDEVYKIGIITRTHGVKGEVSLSFTDDVWDRVEADYLVLRVDGLLVPFFMEEYRFRNDTVCLVKFCDIDTQQRAQELTGCDVYFPRALAEEADDDLSLASLVGFTIINDGDGKTAAHTVPDDLVVGIISSIDDTTANILFELDNGRLIPANDDLIVDIDAEHRQIRMNIPEGLLDI